MKKINFFSYLLAIAFVTIGSSVFAQTNMAKDKMMKHDSEVTIIDLTQTPGEFDIKELNLKPGKYQFKVTNKSVDHQVGFAIQKASDKDGDLMKTALPTSFASAMIGKGETQSSGIVELEAGEYVYSCPMNPTPKYAISVGNTNDKMMKHDSKVTVIELNQTPGEFDLKQLDLKPGKYRFVVTNKSVDHQVGFTIQKAADKDGDLMKTALPTSFTSALISKGDTQSSGIVELKTGEYVYSCPMNPTPKYSISVSK